MSSRRDGLICDSIVANVQLSRTRYRDLPCKFVFVASSMDQAIPNYSKTELYSN